MISLKNVDGIEFTFVDGIVIPVWPATDKASDMSCCVFCNIDAGLGFAIAQTACPALLALLVRHVGQVIFRYNPAIGCSPGINVHSGDSGSVLQGCLPDDHV